MELLLGICATGYPGRSLFVFDNLVGAYAIFYGKGAIIVLRADPISAGGRWRADQHRPPDGVMKG